jgi:hypothetical protein
MTARRHDAPPVDPAKPQRETVDELADSVRTAPHQRWLRVNSFGFFTRRSTGVHGARLR